MRFRYSRSAPVAELGQIGVSSRKRVVLILSVAAVSLLLPGLAVETASAGGTGELSRIAAAVAKFLLFYSGVFALIALSAAVAAGLLATDRIIMTPDARIRAQALHRAMSLTGMAALANHIMLEILASRAGIIDSFIPFLSARNTLFMGLGTVSWELFIVIILTGVLRRRFTGGTRPVLWRWLHLAAYAAWPMAVLHGLLAGRSAKPYINWSYGACLAAAALALTARYVMLHRGRNAAPGGLADRAPAPFLSPPTLLSSRPAALARSDSLRPTPPPAVAPPAPSAAARPAAQHVSWRGPQGPHSGPLRALPSPDPDEAWDGAWLRPPRWAGAPWSRPGPAQADDQDAWMYDQDAWMPDPDASTAPPAAGWEQ